MHFSKIKFTAFFSWMCYVNKFPWQITFNVDDAMFVIKGAATPKSVKNCKNVLLHINILEPFTNHGKVKKIIISIILEWRKKK